MNPLLFRHYAALNIPAVLSIMYMEAKIFFQTRPMLISQLLTPLLYFIFIVTALSETIGNITINDVLIPYNEYALVGILTMSMMGQMSRVIYRMTVDRRYGFFALKMQAGIKPFFYILSMSTGAVLGYATQAIIFYLIILAFHLHFTLFPFICMWGIGLISLFFWISLGTVITMFIKTYQMRDMVSDLSDYAPFFQRPLFLCVARCPFFYTDTRPDKSADLSVKCYAGGRVRDGE